MRNLRCWFDASEHRTGWFCGALVAIVLCSIGFPICPAVSGPGTTLSAWPVDSNASDLALDPGDHCLCLVYPSLRSVACIDTKNRKRLWTLRPTGAPTALTVDSGERRVYVGTQNDSLRQYQIVVADDATGRVLPPIAVDAPIAAIVVDSGRGRVYALEPSIHRVIALNSRSGSLLWSETVRDSPTAAAIDLQEDRLFVVSHDAGTLFALDGSNGRILDSRLVGEQPTSLAIDPTTGELFVAESKSGCVGIYDAGTLNSAGAIPSRTGAADIALDPATGRAFLTEPAAGQIEYLDCDSRSTIGEAVAGMRPVRIARDGSSGKMYVADADSSFLRIADTKLPLSDLRPDAPGDRKEGASRTPAPALDLGPQSQTYGAAFVPGRDEFVACGADGAVRAWDTRTGQPLWTSRSVDHWCGSIACSRDGRLIASGMSGGWFVIWDAETGRELRRYLSPVGEVDAVAFASSGVEVAVGGNGVCLALVDLRDGLVHSLPGHHNDVGAVAFSPDGKYLASGCNDSTIALWDAATGQRLDTGKSPLHYGAPDPVTDTVRSLAFSPDGEQIATANERGDVRIWQRRSLGKFKELASGWNDLKSVSWSPDGRFIAVSGGPDWGETTGIYDLQTGHLRLLPGVKMEGGFSADGRMLGINNPNNGASLLDLASGNRKELWGGEVAVETTAVSSDGALAAIARGDAVEIWSLHSGTLQRVLRGHRSHVDSVVFSPDGQRLASGDDGGGIRLWSVSTGRLLHLLTGYRDKVYGLAFVPGHRVLLSAGNDGRVIFWDEDSGLKLRELTLKRMSTDPFCITLSRDGRLAGIGDGQFASVCRLDDGKVLWQNNVGWLRRLSFSPDGRRVALPTTSGVIDIRDPVTGQHVGVLGAPSYTLLAATYSPDGSTIACGDVGYDKIVLYDVRSGKPRWSRVDARGDINSVCYTPDGRRIIVGSMDGGTRIYETATGQLLATLFGFSTSGATADERAYLAITPAGYYQGSASAEKLVGFGVDGGLFPATCFNPVYYRPDLVRAALDGRPPNSPALHGPRPPRCQFILPTTGERSADGRLIVAIQAVDDSAVRRVVLSINGAPATIVSLRWNGGSHGDPRPLEIGARPLFIPANAIEVGARPLEIAARAGTNSLLNSYRARSTFIGAVRVPAGVRNLTLTAAAVDDDGILSPPARLTLVRADGAPATGRLLGLCVGISHYMDSQLDLRYAARDAESLANALRHQTRLYRSVSIQSLVDEDATAAGLLAALDHLAAEAGPSDTVILFLSGHGGVTPAGDFAFATYGVTRRSLTEVGWTAMMAAVRQVAQRSRRVVMLLDACRSGSPFPPEALARAGTVGRTGLVILASSRGNEVSLESSENGHGFFTQALLEALDGKADASPTISLWRLYDYVHNRVRQLSANIQTPSLPLLEDFDTDAPLLDNTRGTGSIRRTDPARKSSRNTRVARKSLSSVRRKSLPIERVGSAPRGIAAGPVPRRGGGGRGTPGARPVRRPAVSGSLAPRDDRKRRRVPGALRVLRARPGC